MARIRQLDWYQRGILLLLLALALVFAVIDRVRIARVGFLYQDKIFVPSEENGVTVYSGKISGEPAQFTVSEDKAVSFHCGEKTYGPYTVTEDPTALPEVEIEREGMTGVEIREGEKLVFRGGFWQSGEDYWLRRQDGSMDLSVGVFVTGDGVMRDANGNAVDPLEPALSDILRLVYGPELTHKGSWLAWFGAVFLSILNAVSILYADELFHWDLSFQIRNAETAEPSDWELMKRYLSCTVLTIMLLVIYIVGLRA